MITNNFVLTGGMILTAMNIIFISSPDPGTGRGDERMINPICSTAPTANLDKSLLSQQPTVTTVEVAR